MKLILKGKLEDENQLPKGNLPQRAVKFREPENLKELNSAAFSMCIVAVVIAALAVLLKWAIYGKLSVGLHIFGVVLSLLAIFPHELLHAAAFPKDAEVEIWYSLKNLAAFCMSTYPLSKIRFIVMSLLPNFVLGFLPITLWVFIPIIPEYETMSGTLFTFGALSLLFGCGDYLNVKNASRQMPKGSITQLCGFNSYWYYPGENEK